MRVQDLQKKERKVRKYSRKFFRIKPKSRFHLLFRLLQPCNLYIWFESMMQCLYFVYLDHRRKICHTILLRYGLAEHSLEMSLEESPDFKVPR